MPCRVPEAWDLVTTPPGLHTWLRLDTLPTEPGTSYRTSDGTVGEIRSHHAQDRVRLTWRPNDWDHESTVQVALTPRSRGTAVRFHQERLASEEEREEMLEHWEDVLEALAGLVGS